MKQNLRFGPSVRRLGIFSSIEILFRILLILKIDCANFSLRRLIFRQSNDCVIDRFRLKTTQKKLAFDGERSRHYSI